MKFFLRTKTKVRTKLPFSFSVLASVLPYIYFVDIISFACEGGFDMLGRSVDQIRTTEQVNAAMSACQDLKLDGLVIIGGIR